jgi:hypothetical protein
MLAVTAKSGRVELSWQYAADDALGFVIFRKDAASEAGLAATGFQLLETLSAAAQGFTDTGLLPGRVYQYQLQVETSRGRSSPVVSESVTPLPTELVLTVLRAGRGSGTVTSSPPGINCTAAGTGCQATFAAESTVTLTATPNAASSFAGFSGDCEGASCTLVLERDSQVTVTFNEAQRNLMVTLAGAGGGQVVLSPGGASCRSAESPCMQSFNLGTTVTARAEAEADSRFVGWSGACSDVGTCQVTMSENHQITATFERIPLPVIEAFEVSEPEILRGNATELSWVVTSEAPVELFLQEGTSDVQAVTGSDFTIVSPEATTSYTLIARNAGGEVSRSLTVTVKPAFILSVVKQPASSGRTVRSSPAGINCGLDCSESYPPGEVVRLTAGTIFVTWSGCDRVSGTACMVTMDADRTVSANFSR